MEKFLDNIKKDIEYKIVLKNDNPIYAFITDADSKFIYMEFPNSTPFLLCIDEIKNIIPSNSNNIRINTRRSVQ
jgi:hypothetical protein